MTPFDINFRPPLPWPRVGAWIVIAVLAFGSGTLGWKVWSVRVETQALAKQSATLVENIKKLEAQQMSARVRPPYLEALSDLVRVATFPIDGALRRLETVDVAGTRVIELDIDSAEHRATAIVEATSATAMQDYLERLEVSGSDGGWRLQQLQSGAPLAAGPADRAGQGSQSVAVNATVFGQSMGGPSNAGPATPVILRATLTWQMKQ